MRETGLTYKELEQQGVYLAVSEISVRYRAAARYDDLVAGAVLGARARVPPRDLRLAVERAETGELLATGETSLRLPTHQHTLTRFRRMSLTCSSRFPIRGPVRRSCYRSSSSPLAL